MSGKSKTSIEERTEELNKLLAWFDSEDFSVEAAMEKYKQAEAIAESIKQDLKTLKNEIKLVKQKFDEAAE